MADHYFTEDPSTPLVRTKVRAQVWGLDLELVSGSGVFSQGRVDPGTAVLFKETEPPTTGSTYLDLGCGYGLIGAALALSRPEAEVWGVDVNERAIQLTNENAAALAIAERLKATTPLGVPADLRFDEIWSNPPIRVGKSALHTLLLVWLPRLAPGGRAVLVVGKNLGADSLQRWLEETGHPTVRLGSSRGFRVLEVRRS